MSSGRTIEAREREVPGLTGVEAARVRLLGLHVLGDLRALGGRRRRQDRDDQDGGEASARQALRHAR